MTETPHLGHPALADRSYQYDSSEHEEHQPSQHCPAKPVKRSVPPRGRIARQALRSVLCVHPPSVRQNTGEEQIGSDAGCKFRNANSVARGGQGLPVIVHIDFNSSCIDLARLPLRRMDRAGHNWEGYRQSGKRKSRACIPGLVSLARKLTAML
jgi:hypothetical protein